jgi:hypothetical protein
MKIVSTRILGKKLLHPFPSRFTTIKRFSYCLLFQENHCDKCRKYINEMDAWEDGTGNYTPYGPLSDLHFPKKGNLKACSFKHAYLRALAQGEIDADGHYSSKKNRN